MAEPITTERGVEQVFLSYSRTDTVAAIALRSELEKAGISVFRDEDSVRVGDHWMDRLQTALQDCSAFVLLLGQDAVQRWVGAEVQVALIRNLSPHDDALRLPIFPIALPGSDLKALPPFLTLFQVQHWSSSDGLSGEVLAAIRDKVTLLGDAARSWPQGESPFLGLGSFQTKHAHLFFGRRRETLEALQYLGTQAQSNPENINAGAGNFCRWLQIEGNSGSGKSSLVNAGMLPMIEQGALWSGTGFGRWKIIGPMMPGEKPLDRLASVLDRALISESETRDHQRRLNRLEAEDDRVLASMIKDVADDDTAFLLVVDQFEELFTFADPTEKRRFDAQLANVLQDKDCPLFLVTTVRIDFLEGFEQLPRLSGLYNAACKRYLLKTITAEGLREVIEQPARLARLDGVVPKGKQKALELLLALTRINPEGRHTRQRIALEEARMIAGNNDAKLGRKVIDYLSSRPGPDLDNRRGNGGLRLVTVVGDTETDGDARVEKSIDSSDEESKKTALHRAVCGFDPRNPGPRAR